MQFTQDAYPIRNRVNKNLEDPLDPTLDPPTYVTESTLPGSGTATVEGARRVKARAAVLTRYVQTFVNV